MTPYYYCCTCHRDTPHSHTHQAAHGLAGTHMAGTECFICLVCKRSTFSNEPGASRYPFRLDKTATSNTETKP